MARGMERAPHLRGSRYAPDPALDAAHQRMLSGDFDEGLRVAFSCLATAEESLNTYTYKLVCRRIRASHPIVGFLARSPLLRAVDQIRIAEPQGAPVDIWAQALEQTPESCDDLAGQAIDTFLRKLRLGHKEAWSRHSARQAFFDCFHSFDVPPTAPCA